MWGKRGGKMGSILAQQRIRGGLHLYSMNGATQVRLLAKKKGRFGNGSVEAAL